MRKGLTEGLRGIFREASKGRLVQRIRRMSIRWKLLSVFLFVSVVPILVLQSVSFLLSYSSINQKISQFSRENLQQKAKSLEIVIMFYRDMLVQIATDRNIIEQTRLLDSDLEQDRHQASERLRMKLLSLVYSQRYVRSIAIFSPGGKREVLDRQSIWIEDTIWSGYSDIRETKVFSDSMKSNRMIIQYAEVEGQINGSPSHVLHLSMRLGDLSNINMPAGVVVITIEESALSDVCNYVSTDAERGNLTGLTFVVDALGSVISYPAKQHIGRHLAVAGLPGSTRRLAFRSFVKLTGALRADSAIVTEMQQPFTGWTIVNVIDRNDLFGEIRRFQTVTVLLGLALAACSVLVILYVLHSISRSISRIVDTMQVVQGGELLARIELDTRDEISIIGDSFNVMMSTINNLVGELKRHAVLSREAANRQREAEIRALEAQINPHFLFNTLDSINWMAIEKEEHEISSMLKSLAQILRYSIARSNSMVRVADEVQWLREYLYLQKLRFAHSFEWVIDAPRSLLGSKMHKLLLQPFVENAIVHGFEGMTAGGLLRIALKSRNGRLTVSIEDNGRGIEAETLRKLRALIDGAITEEGGEERSEVGIKNVIGRIRIYYGEVAAVRIDSPESGGTRVELILPRIREGRMQ